MKIAVVVNLSKEKAISCAKEIAILFLGENADVVMLSECKPFYKGIKVMSIPLTSFSAVAMRRLRRAVTVLLFMPQNMLR